MNYINNDLKGFGGDITIRDVNYILQMIGQQLDVQRENAYYRLLAQYVIKSFNQNVLVQNDVQEYVNEPMKKQKNTNREPLSVDAKVERYPHIANPDVAKTKYTFQNYVVSDLPLQQMNHSLMAGMRMLLFTLKRLLFSGTVYGTTNKLVRHNL